jgi:hypothetical protein
LPHLQKLLDKYKGQNFAMIAINTVPEQNEMIPEWKAKGKYTFPIVSTDWDFAEKNYGVRGTPASFLLNAEGKVIFRNSGFDSGGEKIMEAEIRELLGLDPFEGIEASQKTESAGKN